MKYYLAVIKKYAVFSGRSQRAEYWFFFLFNIIIGIILGIIDSVIGRFGSSGPLVTIYSLAVLIPQLAVGIRRLHDTNHSGWWLFITLIPIIGIIWYIVLMVIDGTPGDNKYGPNPKHIQTTTSPSQNGQTL